MTSDSRSRVLVAEDNSALSQVVKFNLERAGIDVTVVDDGQHAWETLVEGDFHMLITDQQMPKLSGIELTRKLRADDRFRTLPIMMLTAKRLELDLERIRAELNINHIYPKPFSPTAIVKVVQEQLATLATSLS